MSVEYIEDYDKDETADVHYVEPERLMAAPEPVKFKGIPLDSKDFEYRLYDYAQNGVDSLRDKRQIEIQLGERNTQKYLTPLYVITGVFAAVMIIGPFLVRKGPNRGIVQACILLTSFCMWIFWFTIYFGQMNPLMGPRLENTTVAWIAYKLGKPVNYTQ